MIAISHYKKQLADQKSFYNKKNLFNIIKHGFYNINDQSNLLALFLLIHLDKKPDDCIRLILERGGDFMKKLGDFESFKKGTDKMNIDESKGKTLGELIRESHTLIDELTDKMNEPKVVNSIIKMAIRLNEPDIAVMAGKELVLTDVEIERPDKERESKPCYIMDHASLFSYLQQFFVNDRDDITS